MGRRKKEAGLIEVAMTSPWQFAASLCGAALFVAVVVIPLVAGSNVFLKALAPLATAFLLFFAAVFGLISGSKFLATRTNATASEKPQWSTSRSQVHRRVQSNAKSASRYQEFVPPIRVDPYIASKPTQWSLELLQSLDWKRFEEVVAAYFREKNFRSETLAYGPDGGVDARLFFGDLDKPVAIIQCKAWGKRQVGVAPVRELLGVMTHERVPRGYFAAAGDFSEEAVNFAKSNPIMLISGNDFLVAIARMDLDQLARHASQGCTMGR